MLNPIHARRATNNPELSEIIAALLRYAWQQETLVLKRVNVRLAESEATPVQAVVMAVTLPPEEANFLFESLRGMFGYGTVELPSTESRSGI